MVECYLDLECARALPFHQGSIPVATSDVCGLAVRVAALDLVFGEIFKRVNLMRVAKTNEWKA